MCLITDKKYLNMVASSLDGFAWKKADLANFRCPYCGDSKKNKRKARGFMYTKGNDMFYRCHNCSVSTTMYKFLEKVSPTFCREYSLERWKGGENGHSNYKKPVIKIEFDNSRIIGSGILKDFNKISELETDHPARQYLASRLIPDASLDGIYYSDNFYKFWKDYNKELFTDDDVPTISQDKRVVFVIRNFSGDIVGLTGRSIMPKTNLRYLNLKVKDGVDCCMYGAELVNTGKTVYVLEGPIDSIFIENSVAICGISKGNNLTNYFSDFVYVLDNEPRNKEVVAIYEKLIEKDCKIVIWPENLKYKDINEMIMDGYSKEKINTMVKENTCGGITSKLRFSKWKKI